MSSSQILFRLLLPVTMVVPISIGYLVHSPPQARAEEVASAGSLSFFADEQDAPTLLGRLNADPEIAFIVPDGPRMPPPDAPLPPPSSPTEARATPVYQREPAPRCNTRSAAAILFRRPI